MLSLSSSSSSGGGAVQKTAIDEEAYIECTEKTLSMISSLYLDEEASDCVLISKNGKRFPALRALVGKWSTKLKELLFVPEFEIGKELVLPQVTDLGLEIFLKVVYFGCTKDYTMDKFIDLYTFAHTYGMQEIEEMTLEIMRNAAVDADSSFLLLENCSQYLEEFKEINSLKKTLLTKISADFDTVCESQHFVKLPIEDLKIMLAGKELICSEGNLFKSLMRWIEHDKENRLQYLDYFLGEIRFPIVEGEVLATVDSHPLLVSKRDVIFPKLYEAMRFNLNPAMIENKEDKNFRERDCVLYDFLPKGMSIKFTNLGATGKNGPTVIGSQYDSCKFLKNKVKLENGIQKWVVPATGFYKITAAGARGGKNTYTTTFREGYGAIVSGVFHLKRGRELSILVGQVGGDCTNGSSCGAGGGGGGTFVVDSDTMKPLIIGGGGNGANWYSWTVQSPGGQVYTKGPAEARSQKAAKGDRGGGGGGLFIDGGAGDQCVGGKSFKNGGEGGTFSNACGANGGFGGGGGSLYEGGGGGGFGGGECTPQNNYGVHYVTHAAYSYNEGVKQEGTPDSNNGDGYVELVRVIISQSEYEKEKKTMDSTVVEEPLSPSTPALIGSSGLFD
ncbi:predicted protein [Naegleria gruberi]|uniref:Predicted protein n=1 Tax=Naegleria gruberi TaxID=5762 RepID=D2VNC6_NAEGR|nr:uncharacterized protein NAEGRDRAFT_70448 [Naegleria gruberi]EFC41714.1 predicted protein [Naegleria gruberi]|eukprot:XP_002674458.1 predicted protein [Naegleria gruberi strain NEG-M]